MTGTINWGGIIAMTLQIKESVGIFESRFC
jgi:hypothetical protein